MPQRILYGPPLPPRAAEPRRPWGEGYIFEKDISDRAYVVVEEVADEYVGIAVSPWPRVCEDGGLDFGEEEGRRPALVDRDSFQRRLADRRVVAYEMLPGAEEALRARPLASGDVFAIETKLPKDREDLRDEKASWIEGTVVDVTAMARDAAKASMLAALSGTPMSVDEAAALSESQPEPPAEPPLRA